jgi:hypothetical protein
VHLFDQERPVIHWYMVIGILLGLSLAPGRSIADLAWSSTTDNLSAPGQNAWSPQIAIDGSGNVTAVWMGIKRGNVRYNIQSARFSNGNWGEATDLTPAGEGTNEPHIVADREGNVTAVWVLYRVSSGFGEHVNRPGNRGGWLV